ncbi:MAG: hypothetical protein U0Q20_11920 [Mycobacterium sp.]|nr:hypothetical protein [Mycobacterium sp.]
MSADVTRKSRFARFAALAVAATGLTHLIKPQAWEPLTKPAFPDNTRQHVYTNGGIETALGLGLLSRRTRKAALGGFLAYGAYLGANTLRNGR